MNDAARLAVGMGVALTGGIIGNQFLDPQSLLKNLEQSTLKDQERKSALAKLTQQAKSATASKTKSTPSEKPFDHAKFRREVKAMKHKDSGQISEAELMYDQFMEKQKKKNSEKKPQEMAHLLAGAALGSLANQAVAQASNPEVKVSKQQHHQNLSMEESKKPFEGSEVKDFLFSARNFGKQSLPKALKILAAKHESNEQLVHILEEASQEFALAGNKKVRQVLENILAQKDAKKHIESITSTIKLGDRTSLIQATHDLDDQDLNSVKATGFTKNRGYERPGSLYGKHVEEQGYDVDDPHDIEQKRKKLELEERQRQMVEQQRQEKIRIDKETQDRINMQIEEEKKVPVPTPVTQQTPDPQPIPINRGSIYFEPTDLYSPYVKKFGKNYFYGATKMDANDFYKQYPQYEKLELKDKGIFKQGTKNFDEKLDYIESKISTPLDNEQKFYLDTNLFGNYGKATTEESYMVKTQKDKEFQRSIAADILAGAAAGVASVASNSMPGAAITAALMAARTVEHAIPKIQKNSLLKDENVPEDIKKAIALNQGFTLEQAQTLFPDQDFSQYSAGPRLEPDSNMKEEPGHPLPLPNAPISNSPLNSATVNPNIAPQLDVSAAAYSGLRDLIGQAGIAAAAFAVGNAAGPYGGLLFAQAISGILNQAKILDPSRTYDDKIGSQALFELEKGILKGVQIANPEWVAPQVLNPLMGVSDNTRTSLTVQDVFAKGVMAQNGVSLAQRDFQNWYKDSQSPYAVEFGPSAPQKRQRR
jgi:hypothetical protein